MDASRFDSLSKTIGAQRRTVLGGLLAGLLLPLEAVARKQGKKGKKDKQRKKKGQGTDRGKVKQRTSTQAEVCWRAGACIPKKGSNVSRCDLAGYTPSTPLNCTGCNISRANLRGAQLQGANFTKANLSGACLVDADFTDATFARTTNLANAIFCRTRMPDGSTNNGGCDSGTACCPTCAPTTCQSLGKTCGSWPDGCGGTLQCGSCAGRQICDTGACQACDVCASGCPFTSVQAAIDATPQLSTIRVCPGTYVEDGGFIAAVEMLRGSSPLTLIGAGDGDDPATNTILKPTRTDRGAVYVFQPGTVRLEGLRLTGGTGTNGCGLGAGSTLTVARCTITGNTMTRPEFPAGVHIFAGGKVTFVDTHVINNTGANVGGIAVADGSLTLDTLSRVTGNEFTAPTGVGGIEILFNASVILPSVDNVTGNESPNCRGTGFSGPGASCLNP